LIRASIPAAWVRGIDSPALPCALTLAAYAIFVALRISNLDSDPSAFVVAGDRYANPAETPEVLAVLSDSSGYDGQFFYRLALDPFTRVEKEHGITLDVPAWRQQRILYPLLVWTFARGDPERSAVWMIGLNLIALGAVGWLSGDLAQKLGRHAAAGLLIAFYPGLLYSLSRDLAEPVTAAWVLLGVAFFLRGRHTLAAFATCLAVLTRETSLLVPAGMGMVVLLRGLRGRGDASWPMSLVYCAPLLVYALVQSWLVGVWGQLPTGFGSGVIGVPFAGMWDSLAASFPPQDRHQRLMLVNFAFMGCFSLAALGSALAVEGLEALKFSWLLYALLALSLGAGNWVTELEFLRALNEYWLLGALLVIAAGQGRPRLWWISCAATATVWLMVYQTRTHWI
jgi:hypothetical protein